MINKPVTDTLNLRPSLWGLVTDISENHVECVVGMSMIPKSMMVSNLYEIQNLREKAEVIA